MAWAADHREQVLAYKRKYNANHPRTDEHRRLDREARRAVALRKRQAPLQSPE